MLIKHGKKTGKTVNIYIYIYIYILGYKEILYWEVWMLKWISVSNNKLSGVLWVLITKECISCL